MTRGIPALPPLLLLLGCTAPSGTPARVLARPQTTVEIYPWELPPPAPTPRIRAHARRPPRPRVVIPCRQALKLAKARFSKLRLRPKRARGGLVCQVVDPVMLLRGPSGLRFGAPRVNCAFALRLLRFEKILQSEARRAFGEPVQKLMMWSSYRCSIIAGTMGMVSEHASGNAIDLGGVILRSGRRTTVLRHYPKRGNGKTKRGRFWVQLSKRLFKEGVFTVVLTPRFNRTHHNHLHLDAASYVMDGT